MYYVALAVFAYVFTSRWLILSWTTLVAVIYSVLSFLVEPGLDLAGKDEQHLFYRLVALYAVSAAVGIIAGLERESRGRDWSASGNSSASASRFRRPFTTPPPSGRTWSAGGRAGDGVGR